MYESHRFFSFHPPYQHIIWNTPPLAKLVSGIVSRQKESRSLVKYQIETLQKILQYSSDYSPYYRREISIACLADPDRSITLSDLQSVPLLNRQDVIDHFYDLCAEDYPYRYCCIKRTSGSTGEPVKVLLDYKDIVYDEILIFHIARRFAMRQRDFLPFMTSMIYVTGFTKSKPFTSLLPSLNFSRFYKVNLSLDYWQFGNNTARFFERNRASIITGMPEHLLMLVDILQNSTDNLTIRPKFIYTSGNKLTEQTREILQEYFQSPVVDVYAMAEFGIVGVECPNHKGYHIQDRIVMEIVRPDGTPVRSGESAEIVITDLKNYAMPFIRYRTGDFGRWAIEPCGCGNQWPLLEALEGRSGDVYYRMDGNAVNPYCFIREVDQLPLVQYQITQKNPGQLDVKYVPIRDDLDLDVEIRRSIWLGLGESVEVSTEKVRTVGAAGQKLRNFVAAVSKN